MIIAMHLPGSSEAEVLRDNRQACEVRRDFCALAHSLTHSLTYWKPDTHPHRYRDPLTGQPYANLRAFRILRERFALDYTKHPGRPCLRIKRFGHCFQSVAVVFSHPN